MSLEAENGVKKLENRATRLQSIIKLAPRAFVMEFAGTPKSGKSTSVEAIRHFFARHGFRVHILSERAAVCPIPMKGHLFFNTWCATSMLAELIANVETETDIIIVDRGLFDALVWLTLQEKRGELTDYEARTIESFLLLDRWRKLIDLSVVMSVSAEEAISRENKNRITQKAGSIMNEDVLTAITESVEEAIIRYKPKFRAIIDHPTTRHEVRESNIRLAENVLDVFERFINPEVLVVPKKLIEDLLLNDGGLFGDEEINQMMDSILPQCHFIPREVAESESDIIQIIPCGLLTFRNQVFVFQRKEADPKYRLYGKTTIWQGCHVAKQDSIDTKELIKKALLERISSSLFLSRQFPIKLLGCCWAPEVPNTSRHFGVIYRIQIDNTHTALDLRKKEFRKTRGYGLTGKFYTMSDVSGKREELSLEIWSCTILDNIEEVE